MLEPASTMSARERARNDQPAANQQGEGDTAENRQNAVTAICGLCVGGGGSLCREQTHPEVTHGSAQIHVASRLDRVLPATSDRGRAYSALQAGTYPLDRPLWSAKHRSQRHSS